jgi:hypothetical protein
MLVRDVVMVVVVDKYSYYWWKNELFAVEQVVHVVEDREAFEDDVDDRVLLKVAENWLLIAVMVDRMLVHSQLYMVVVEDEDDCMVPWKYVDS